MLKRSARRSGGRRVESSENGYNDAQNSKSEGGDQTPELLAEMARGMIDTQSKVNELSGTLNTEEITTLLRQINSQLQNMQNTQVKSGGQAFFSNSPAAIGQSGSQDIVSGNKQADLAALFSQLLRQGSGKQQTAGQQPLSGAGGEVSGQNQRDQSGGQSGHANDPQSQKNVNQSAAQLLAQAQYELSNELDASLKKLKQVISESEKIAARISNLLGEEKNPNKS